MNSVQILDSDSIDASLLDRVKRKGTHLSALELAKTLGIVGVSKRVDGRHKGKKKVRASFTKTAKRAAEKERAKERTSTGMFHIQILEGSSWGWDPKDEELGYLLGRVNM